MPPVSRGAIRPNFPVRRTTRLCLRVSQPFLFVQLSRPEVVKRTCHRHHYLPSSWLHLPEPPPTCLLLRFMWLRRRRPIQPFSAEWDSFYADSCVYDTVVGSETGFGPVCLRSVINESLKRLGQFSQDKWWKGRTANVRTQTLQDDGVISHLTPHTTGARRCS